MNLLDGTVGVSCSTPLMVYFSRPSGYLSVTCSLPCPVVSVSATTCDSKVQRRVTHICVSALPDLLGHTVDCGRHARLLCPVAAPQDSDGFGGLYDHGGRAAAWESMRAHHVKETTTRGTPPCTVVGVEVMHMIERGPCAKDGVEELEWIREGERRVETVKRIWVEEAIAEHRVVAAVVVVMMLAVVVIIMVPSTAKVPALLPRIWRGPDTVRVV